ncbi:MAG: hypothetical protein VB025_04870 [Sphaerochaeta sp.]|jgi:hypothetical protein|nr:hypothetical protein [Sphaerochaeta sp.]PKL25303.1 MAG: hypothetical protein CVV46_16290 [Spirochaetae bacterium HGW-Spirochaetae-2]
MKIMDIKQNGEFQTIFLKGQILGPSSKRMPWMLKNMSYIKAFSKFSRAKLILGRANLELSKLDHNDPLYMQRLDEFNTVMLECSQARWYSSVGIVTRSKRDWKKALDGFNTCLKHGDTLLNLLEGGSKEKLDVTIPVLSKNGTEIEFANGAPVVPGICPVVILQGSSHEMGYQYAQQLVQIFGPWILEKKAQRTFADEAVTEIRKWEEQIQKHAPEILDMCRGWAEGATDLGIEMSYLDVLEIWTGHMPPKTTYMGRGDKISDVPPPIACSGAGAWGKATTDGKLVTGSSGDHDPSFPVVIMAYPDTGNNFMFTTFSAVGDIVLVGSQHMFGFPGINNRGLAYIEHGGQPRLIEPKKYWGYGLRRATSVFHILRFANNAKEALQMELEFPIGDVGMDSGTIGGFYADNTYGYVLESRKEPVAIRESGYMGETDFLFANNSAMHKEAAKAGWMQEDQKKERDWKWDVHGGWYPERFTGFKLSELFKGGEAQAFMALRGMYRGCMKRNLYHYNILNRAVGHVDMEYMKMIFRNSGTIPSKPWKMIHREYNKSGEWGDISVGNSSNGIVTVTKPDVGDDGLFAVCTGEAKRGVTPTSPFLASFCPIHGETNAFWEIKLADKPENAARYAYMKAKEYLKETEGLIAENTRITNPQTMNYILRLMDQAVGDMRQGENKLETAGLLTGRAAVYDWSYAARAFTRAQVKVLMAHDMIMPPPTKPEDFQV